MIDDERSAFGEIRRDRCALEVVSVRTHVEMPVFGGGGGNQKSHVQGSGKIPLDAPSHRSATGSNGASVSEM